MSRLPSAKGAEEKRRRGNRGQRGASMGLETKSFQALRTKRHKLYCVTLDLWPCERDISPTYSTYLLYIRTHIFMSALVVVPL